MVEEIRNTLCPVTLNMNTETEIRKGYLVLEQVRKQIDRIVDYIFSGDDDQAIKHAQWLSKMQLESGDEKLLAKSLTLLATKANEYENQRLQLLFAEQAVQYAPRDARALGALADAYFKCHRFDEAHQLYEEKLGSGVGMMTKPLPQMELARFSDQKVNT